MIHLHQWLLFLSVTFAVSASPGPLMLLTMSNGINYGYARSLAGMLGASCGNLILVGITGLGIGVLLRCPREVFLYIKWFGVLYLIYLGVRQLVAVQDGNLTNKYKNDADSATGIFLKSFIVSLTNPKGLIYFAALFPQFVVANETIILQFIVLTLTFLLTDFLWMSVYAKGGHLLVKWLNARGHKSAIQRVSGFLLLSAALLLAFMQ